VGVKGSWMLLEGARPLPGKKIIFVTKMICLGAFCLSILKTENTAGADPGIHQGGGGHCGGRNFFHLQITVCEF